MVLVTMDNILKRNTHCKTYLTGSALGFSSLASVGSSAAFVSFLAAVSAASFLASASSFFFPSSSGFNRFLCLKLSLCFLPLSPSSSLSENSSSQLICLSLARTAKAGTLMLMDMIIDKVSSVYEGNLLN